MIFSTFRRAATRFPADLHHSLTHESRGIAAPLYVRPAVGTLLPAPGAGAASIANSEINPSPVLLTFQRLIAYNPGGRKWAIVVESGRMALTRSAISLAARPRSGPGFGQEGGQYG